MLHRHWGYFTSIWISILFCMTGLCLSDDVKAPSKPVKKAKVVFVPKITIGKETTWATEPLGPAGFVDYLAVINRQCSQGVTPANNAAVMLYQATGPKPDGRQQPPEFFRLLGVEPPPAEGNYFEDFGNWYKNSGKDYPPGGNVAVLEMAAASGMRSWTADEFPEIVEWLRSIEEPLRRVTDAAERPEYYSPLVSGNAEEGKLIEVMLPGVQTSRALARALLSRAMLRLGEKETFQAWSDLLTIHRLGRLIGRGPTLIEGLVGIAIETMAIQGELRFISETRPNVKFIQRYVKQLANLPPRSLMVDKLNNCERASYLDCCQQFARGRLDLHAVTGGLRPDGGRAEDLTTKMLERMLAQSVDWDEVLKSGNSWYDRLVTAAKVPTYREQMEKLRKLEDELKETKAKTTQGFGLLSLLESHSTRTAFTSNVMISLLLPATTQCVRAENRIRQRYQNLELAFALAAWHDEHQSYPEKLTDLAPKYLAAVPNDLFKDQPLHYERTADGYRFYSVGENEIDDLGLTYGEGMGKDDLGVRMPLSKVTQ